MIDQKKNSKLGVILAVVAIVIAFIAYADALIKGDSSWSNGIILFCALVIFLSNLSIYRTLKIKEHKTNKRIQ